MRTPVPLSTAQTQGSPTLPNLRFAAVAMLAVNLLVTQPVSSATPDLIQDSKERQSREHFDGSVPIVDAHDFINPTSSTEGPSSTIELEKLFWMCDYGASAGVLDVHEIEVCSVVTRQLRLVKFDNDFEKWIEWWAASKQAEHQAAVGAAASGRCAQGEKNAAL